MPKVINRNYSRFYDPLSGVQFEPMLDFQTGCRVAYADVSEELANEYREREYFEALSDDEFIAMTTASSGPKPQQTVTDDPLTNLIGTGSEPPAPPSAEGSAARAAVNVAKSDPLVGSPHSGPSAPPTRQQGE